MRIAVADDYQNLFRQAPNYAALDVFDDEPVLGADDPIVSLPNTLCTPHLGYCTRDTLLHHYQDAVDQIVAFCAGKPVNAINPEAVAPNATLGTLIPSTPAA